jgi:hypothetical protein
MKRFCLSLVLLFGLAGASLAATTSGVVSADETWSGTVTLTGDVVCTSGTITVQPGTIVKCATSNDNVIYGGSSTIWITIMGNGGMTAVGTSGQHITFTTTSLSPARGAWGRIEIMQIKNNANTTFKYCDFSYAQVGLEWRNDAGKTDITRTTVENCTFKHFSMSGMYGTSNCELNLIGCTFEDLKSVGIFMHGSGPVNITDCIINTVSAGIVDAALTGYTNQVMTIDHLTMYNVDMNLASSPTWWTGYGIYCCNTPNQTLNITNSIVSTVSLNGLAKSGFTVNENHNCFNTNVDLGTGLGAIQGGTVHATDLEADPLFTDAANGDFSLDGASPCLTAGIGGVAMGAVHAPIGIHDRTSVTGTRSMELAASPNPLSDRTTFSLTRGDVRTSRVAIYTPAGRLVRSLAPGTLTWNGCNAQGNRVEPGVYVARMTAAAATAQVRIIVMP